MIQITTTELPQTLQTLFIEVERTKTPLTIIHEGKPLVVIYPATTQTPRPAFGTMKGSGEILGDLIAPVAELWEVLECNFYWIPTFGFGIYSAINAYRSNFKRRSPILILNFGSVQLAFGRRSSLQKKEGYLYSPIRLHGLT